MTGKSRGFKKGDFVFTGAFPGIIISDVHTFAPCCEVWGIEQECGSAYASDLQKITAAVFRILVKDNNHSVDPIKAYAKVAQEALKVAGI